jgi:hypothetical protein
LDLLENTPKQLEVDFEESIQEVLIETKETYQPVVETVVEYIPEPEPVVYKEEADFSPEEYTIISYDVAPIIYDYEPLQEWFIPDGNVDEFSMDSLKGLNNAYGTNYKHISLRFYNEYRGSEYSTLEGVTKFLKSYTDNVFYLVGDNEEGNLGWEFHIEISKNESINLINTLKTNEKIKAISIVGSIMPMFKDIEEEIDLEEFKYSQL